VRLRLRQQAGEEVVDGVLVSGAAYGVGMNNEQQGVLKEQAKEVGKGVVARAREVAAQLQVL